MQQKGVCFEEISTIYHFGGCWYTVCECLCLPVFICIVYWCWQVTVEYFSLLHTVWSPVPVQVNPSFLHCCVMNVVFENRQGEKNFIENSLIVSVSQLSVPKWGTLRSSLLTILSYQRLILLSLEVAQNVALHAFPAATNVFFSFFFCCCCKFLFPIHWTWFVLCSSNKKWCVSLTVRPLLVISGGWILFHLDTFVVDLV